MCQREEKVYFGKKNNEARILKEKNNSKILI